MQIATHSSRAFLSMTVSRRTVWWAAAVAYAVLLVALGVRSYIFPVYDLDGSTLLVGTSWAGIFLTVLSRRKQLSKWHYAMAAGLVLITYLSYPDTSRDAFRYLFDGEIIRIWHLSPYTALPINLPIDQYSSIFSGVWWTKIPSPYGPLWQALMVGINFLSGNEVFNGLIFLKLVNAAALLVCARYTYLITRKAWLSYSVLINPVILINATHSPHPDLIIAALLLAAYYHTNAAARGFLVSAAGLIKFHALIFAPFFARRLRDVAKLGIATVAGLGVLLLILKPLTGFELGSMLTANKGGGLQGIFSLPVYNAIPGLSIKTIFGISYALFVTAYAAIAWAYFRGKLSRLNALTYVSLLVPLLLTGLLFPWHFIISVAFLLLSDSLMALAAVSFIGIFSFNAPLNTAVLIMFAGLFYAAGYVIRWVGGQLSEPPKVFNVIGRIIIA